MPQWSTVRVRSENEEKTARALVFFSFSIAGFFWDFWCSPVPLTARVFRPELSTTRRKSFFSFFSARRIERCTPKRPSIVKCLAVKRSTENALPGVLFLSRFSTSFLPEKRDGKLPFRKCFESVHAELRDLRRDLFFSYVPCRRKVNC